MRAVQARRWAALASWCLSVALVGLCPGPVLALYLPSTRAPPCCWAWLGLLPGWVGLGGVVWWSVWAGGWWCSPTSFLPIPRLSTCAYWPTLPTSFAYPGPPCPLLGWSCLTYAYSLATYGWCLPLFPTSFQGYCRASPWLSYAYSLGLPLGCPVLHLLYMGLRPVTCPIPWSGASGSSTLVFGIYVYGFSLLSIGSLPWFRVYHLASQPLGCVLECRLGLLCPCVKVALATPWAVPQSLLPHRGGPEALLHSTVFHLVVDI